MLILSLDLGVTTGWAMLSASSKEDWELEDYGDFVHPGQQEALEALKRWGPSVVIMEKPVLIYPGQLQTALKEVTFAAEAIFPLHENVTPSQWKQNPPQLPPLPRGTSRHVRDAVRIAIWWLKIASDSSTMQA